MEYRNILLRLVIISILVVFLLPPVVTRARAQATGNILVSPTSGLVTTESGGQATFEIVLDRATLQPVKILLESNDTTEGTIPVSSVLFNSQNWSIPQTITITGADDDLTDGDINYIIEVGPAQSANKDFDGQVGPDVSVTNWDNEGGPVANGDAATTNEGQAVIVNVLANDVSLDPPPFTVTITEPAANGNAQVNGDLTTTYTPGSHFVGPDGYTYQVCDARQRCSSARVSITVQPNNRPPQAADDTYTVNQDETLVIAAPGVLSNDTDPDEHPLTVNVTTAPANGVVSLNPDGSFTYTPNQDYIGQDLFNYQASDGSLDSNVAKVSIEVKDVLPPTVEWAKPSSNEEIMLVGKETVELQVNANDNAGIARVHFFRWDPVKHTYIDIADVSQPPYRVELDTDTLVPGWNQIFARAYDAAGNISERQFIWLYQSIRIFMPVIFH